MAMTERAVDIGQYVFTASDQLLLDTSVWLLIYGPQVPGDSRVAYYSGALRKILEAKSRIYIDLIVLSEFINMYARIAYARVKGAPGGQKPSFKEFRRSIDFQPVAQGIAADAKRVLGHCTWLHGTFELPEIDQLLDEVASGEFDFNDKIIATQCSKLGLKLITDDSDFKNFSIPIITANSQLLV